MNTPTPRTNAMRIQVLDNDTLAIKTLETVHASFSRVLERELAHEREKVRTLRNAMKYLLNDDNYIDPQFDPYALASKAFEVTRDAK
jgi:hypothetical protein